MHSDLNVRSDPVVREKIGMQKEAEGMISRARLFRRASVGGIPAHAEDEPEQF